MMAKKMSTQNKWPSVCVCMLNVCVQRPWNWTLVCCHCKCAKSAIKWAPSETGVQLSDIQEQLCVKLSALQRSAQNPGSTEQQE